MDKAKTEKSIDRVTTENLDLALRFFGVEIHKTILDIIIDVVELLEEKGGETSLIDLHKLKDERKKS
jgi:hypothetical protein